MSILNCVMDLKWEVLFLFYFFRQNLIKNRYNHCYKNPFNQIALLSDFISPITSLSRMLPVIVVHVQSNNTATHSNNSGEKPFKYYHHASLCRCKKDRLQRRRRGVETHTHTHTFTKDQYLSHHTENGK